MIHPTLILDFVFVNWQVYGSSIRVKDPRRSSVFIMSLFITITAILYCMRVRDPGERDESNVPSFVVCSKKERERKFLFII